MTGFPPRPGRRGPPPPPAPDAVAPAAAAGDAVRPNVELPPAGVPLPLVLLIFAVLGVGLFVVLNGHRRQLQADAGRPARPSPAGQLAQAEPIPPLAVPPAPPPPTPAPPRPPAPPRIQYVIRPGPAPPPVIQYVERPSPAPPPQPPGRAADPALVLDLGGGGPTPAADDTAATATVLRNRTTLVPEGTLIPAVLETPIDSTRPGPVRALTTGDTWGFDGSRVLIPRGSRLLGDFRSDQQAGQKRVLVSWNRLVRPDGVAIRLTSPSADPLGGIGVAGDVNNHILARATSAVLQTALVVGTNLAARPGAGGVVVSIPSQTIATAAQPLIPTPDTKPTIKVREGAAITVFVARDLDFSGTVNRP
ncbi:TrbI/VirB10 family protein [Caulobacter sp. KR2-114]|uniref:TrbI/VirB10 family protein n=1 Tax=Caulobacter sp. KR2-114 TaxID=3400912 RepID=UPI003BFB7716